MFLIKYLLTKKMLDTRRNTTHPSNGQVTPIRQSTPTTTGLNLSNAIQFIKSLGERFGSSENLVQFLMRLIRNSKERGNFSLQDFANDPILNDKSALTQLAVLLSEGANEFIKRGEEKIKIAKNDKGLERANGDINTAVSLVEAGKEIRVALLRIDSRQFRSEGHNFSHLA